MSILDITKEDIAQLDDTALRELVGRLCEAELRSASDPTSSVKFGGHQDESDGGVDVEIILQNIPKAPDFIKRKHTVIQVKKPKMPKSQIIGEMKPKGILRPVIKELIQEGGSYIIVSSGDDCTSRNTLQVRQTTMKEVTKDEKNSEDLYTDFYDRSRLATWVRNYPSVIIWLRQKIGKPLTGWQPFGNWSNSPEENDIYLLSDDLHFYDDNPDNRKLNAIDGINKLRSGLNIPREAIRLVGLSGVGKTRMVQALFEDSVGENPLDKSLAVYVDLGEEHEPSAKNMAENLIAHGQHLVLIVDNCPPESHRDLAKTVKRDTSKISLLTVEYDVADDEKEETQVFRLEPSGEELIVKLVLRRNSEIGQLNARKIAEFSGGNARLAIALANTIKSGESLGELTEKKLFERLFYQRQGNDQSLLERAEVLSLVYSFDGETSEGVNAELTVLASLIGDSAQGLRRSSAELFRRQLLQKRSKWRAVLPHALANRLAKRALEVISQDSLISTFCAEGNKRLLKSFTRRLSFLHDSEEAQSIANLWLSEGGMLGDVGNFDYENVELFINIASVLPEKALKAIERTQIYKFKENWAIRRVSDLLVNLAYDASLFERCVCILIKIKEIDSNQTSVKLENLFKLNSSGTQATPEHKSHVIQKLINSSMLAEQMTGFFLLESMLKSSHSNNSRINSFGAHSRDWGYQVQTIEEAKNCYALYLKIVADLIKSKDSEIKNRVLTLLAQSFSYLWVKVQMHNELEKLFSDVREDIFWAEGWASIRNIICSKKLSDEEARRLARLDTLLSPKNLTEKIRSYALHNIWNSCDYNHFENYEKIESERQEKVHNLGVEISLDIEACRSLANEFVLRSNVPSYQSAFGAGLAEGATDKKCIWSLLISALKSCLKRSRNYSVICGFISWMYKFDAELMQEWLDQELSSKELRSDFVQLQIATGAGKESFDRLMSILDDKLVDIKHFSQLVYGRQSELFSDNELAELLLKLSKKENGLKLSISILTMRFHGKTPEKESVSIKLLAIGSYFISRMGELIDSDYAGVLMSPDDSIPKIIDFSFNNLCSETQTHTIYQEIKESVFKSDISFDGFPNTFSSLARKCPQVFLDTFLSTNETHRHIRGGDRVNPFEKIDVKHVLQWCSKASPERYTLFASVIPPFEGECFTDKALQLIEHTPDIGATINEFTKYCLDNHWHDLIALDKKILAFEGLLNKESPLIIKSAEEAIEKIKVFIEERRLELEEQNKKKQRFED